jgi:hypothetical protein
LSLPKTDPGGARTSSQTILVGPGELGTVGPKQVGEISLVTAWPIVAVHSGWL